MPKLCEITIPGMSMKLDLSPARHRLLADFADVLDLLAMTTPATVLVVYRGEEESNAWLDSLSGAIAARRKSLAAAAWPDGPRTSRYAHPNHPTAHQC